MGKKIKFPLKHIWGQNGWIIWWSPHSWMFGVSIRISLGENIKHALFNVKIEYTEILYKACPCFKSQGYLPCHISQKWTKQGFHVFLLPHHHYLIYSPSHTVYYPFIFYTNDTMVIGTMIPWGGTHHGYATYKVTFQIIYYKKLDLSMFQIIDMYLSHVSNKMTIWVAKATKLSCHM